MSNDHADQITVDTGIVLALDRTTIHDGTVTGLGSIEVTGDSQIDSSATIDIATITIDDGKRMKLDAVSVSGWSTAVCGSGPNGIVVVEDTFTLTLTGGATL